MVTFPYNTTDFAFTLDDVFINFESDYTNAYFDLTVTIKYFDFFSSVEKTKVLEYKVPLFNRKGSYNIGRKIHRYLANPSAYANTHGFQYQTATVSFFANPKNVPLDAVPFTLDNVKFIAGEKPTLFSNNFSLLSTNTNYERVTENGFFLINFMLPAGNHTLKVLKNNEESLSEIISATATDNVFSKKIVVKDFNGVKGDVFKVQLLNTTISKTFVIFPNNEHSTQLVFVDSFNLFRSLECTGHFSYLNEFNQIKHNYKRNLIEVLEIVTTEKLNKFKINTGWLLKTDTETIDALLACKKVYLVKNNVTVLEMVPIAKKQTAEDSLKELYAYDLEFQINKRNA